MKKVRNGVFEVNSSSTHSVSLHYDLVVYDTIYPNKDEEIILLGGDNYGWEWFKTNDAFEKAKYAAQALYIQEKNSIPDGELSEGLLTLKEVIEDMTFCKVEFSEHLENGYMENASIIKSDREFLHNFIFNKNSWLFGGNDNTVYYNSHFDVPLFTETEEIPVIYKYSLELVNDTEDVIKTDIKFKEYPTQEDINHELYAFFNGKLLYENEEYFLITENDWNTKYTDYKNPYDINKNYFEFRRAKDGIITLIAKNNVYYGGKIDYEKTDEKSVFIRNNLDKLIKTLDYKITEI